MQVRQVDGAIGALPSRDVSPRSTNPDSPDKRRRGSLRQKVPRPPPPSSPTATRVMRANRPRQTGPERALQKALRKLGVRGFRVNAKDVPGRPDIAFLPDRMAVFVHGCFWHQHGCARSGRDLPKSNRDYWKQKFATNRERDERKEAELRDDDWTVLTIWECEIDSDPVGCARRVAATRGIAHLPQGSKDQSRGSTNP